MSELVKKRRYGPAPIDPADRREHCVSVRLNPAELAMLDTIRGSIQRGKMLRVMAFGNPPPVVPELNRQAWVELSRSASNLNQLAKRLNEGDQADVSEVRSMLADFRFALIGTRIIQDYESEDV